MAYSQEDICIHCIPKRAFAFIAYLQGYIRIMACTIKTFASRYTHKGTLASWHIPKRTFASWHTLKQTYESWHVPRGHLHHGMHHGDIRIMTYLQGGICIIAYLQGYVRIMTCTIRTFTSRHIHKGTLASWHIPNRTFASLHIHKGAFASWHIHKEALASLHTQKGHLHQNICIMTYPLEDCRIPSL